MEHGQEWLRRLEDCGFTESNAMDICQRYDAAKDLTGLEDFVKRAERYHDTGVEA